MNINEFPLSQIEARLANKEPPTFNQNDRIIFDELKHLVLEGDWETLLVRLVETQFPLDYKDAANEGYTLLHYAASSNVKHGTRKVECLRVLIEEFCADPNVKADGGSAPIHLLVSSDCRCMPCSDTILNCVRILLDGSANVDEEDGFGETPLYEAARNRLCKISGFLLERGANINHWVNGTSVATLLAQYVPDVLKLEFDKYITIDSKKGAHRSLRLDFRLLLQEVAAEEGLAMNPPNSASHENGIFSHKRIKRGRRGSSYERKVGRKEQRKNGESGSFLSGKEKSFDAFSTSSSSTSSSSSSPVIPPQETELLNYLLKADFAATEAVVSHPLVEAFVHLKWLSVRKLFFLLRSVYLFFISLYTFYVFDTFVNATCFYNSDSSGTTISANNLPAISGEPDQMKLGLRNDADDEAAEKATFGFFLPTANRGMEDESGKEYSFYYWHSFSEYFKAHTMTCEPTLRVQIIAYVIAIYGAIVVLYEFYKFFQSWYDYFKSPVNYCWWILAVNIGITVGPGLGFYVHSWHYPYAAFSLVYGWILLLVQIGRMPYLGILVGVFTKVLQDFALLLFTFSPVLLAFALGFSVMLPQNEFFRSIPTAFFKVFLMMTGDVDFWGVFRGTWTTAEHQGHVYIPLFIIYSFYILTVTMVLMSLLMGLAVDNIHEVRREAALYRTIRLIEEIGIFESILHKPSIDYWGFLKYFRKLFSITSLRRMNGPELIIFPEDPQDNTLLPDDIKKKLVPYLISSCCCTESSDSHHDPSELRTIGKKKKGRRQNKVKSRSKDMTVTTSGNGIKAMRKTSIAYDHEPGKDVGEAWRNSKEALRKQFFENQTPATTTPDPTSDVVNIEKQYQRESYKAGKNELLNRDLQLYQEVKLLLEDNEKLKNRLETLKRKLLTRK